jgi:hypothetical protein
MIRWMIVTAAIAVAPAVAAAQVAIEDVTVRGASQIDGNVYPLDQMPKDDGGTYQFGGDLEIVIGVLVSATAAKGVPVEVELRAPARRSRLGARVAAIKAKQNRSLFLTAGSKRWVLFVFEYPCTTATLAIKAGKATRSITKEFVCPV